MADVPDTPVQKWLKVTKAYDNEFKKWTGIVEKLIKRYRDDNRTQTGNETARFNILWSNVQTLIPAVYAKMPKADVSRRFGDNDPVGRVAAALLERALDFEIEHYPDFRSAMHNSVEDRFLGGRGVAWVRYEPHIAKQGVAEDGVQVTEDAENEAEEIVKECAPTDYVNWKDFGHTVARTWEEVPQVWRWVYLGREAAEERFGDKGAKLAFNTAPDVKNGKDSKIKDKARICELWDKESGKAVWFSEDGAELLDELSDPLGLEGFFPCAKPLYATTTNDTLVPVPDFKLYQDQANELDILTDRIDGLVKALRVRGVYDASQSALQRLLTEGENNTLIPVDKWGALAEKGGLDGSIDLLPIDMFASTLVTCYQAQANIKGQIYEITGISDIIRGETAASETATAQQIKGQYAGLRLKSMQEGVALYASELLRLKAQIICGKFQPETILAYAAADQMAEADRQLIPQALQLLKNKPLQSFRIEVASDSLVQLDENQAKQDRVEFLNAFANFLREALPAGQQTPELAPMLMEVMKFGISGFKAARPIEGTIDTALQQLTAKAAQQAQNPQPHPEEIKAQAAQQANAAKAQSDQALAGIKAQSDQAVEHIRANNELMLADQQQAHERTLKQMELDAIEIRERFKAELTSATAITVAEIAAKAQADAAEQAANAKVEQDLAPQES